MKFTVKWEVEFYDHDKKLYCDIDEDDDNINNLDDIHEFLEEGVDENKFSPEDQTNCLPEEFSKTKPPTTGNRKNVEIGKYGLKN